MRIQSQSPQVPHGLPASKPQRASLEVAQDLVLLGEIKSQENIIRLSHGMPWASALATASAAYYLADHSVKLAGLVGLPVGLLLGMGLGDYLSTRASSKIKEFQAQLNGPQSPPT